VKKVAEVVKAVVAPKTNGKAAAKKAESSDDSDSDDSSEEEVRLICLGKLS
jgi:hypothetical protein